MNKEMKTVGVAGADRGVGVTHLCLTIAGILRQNGYKVAVLEANANQSFQEIAENFEIAYSQTGFEYLGVDYYLNNPNTSVATIKAEGYDYLIIDNGAYAKCNKSVFTMATYNIIVGSSRYWNFSTLVENVCNASNPNWESYTYVFPFAKNSKTVQKDIVDSLGINSIYFPEYNENPFKDFDVPEINEILGLADDVVIPNQSKSFFGGWKKKEKIKRIEKVEHTEPEYEEFTPPDDKVSIDDLKDVTATIVNSGSQSQLIDALATREFEEASKKYSSESPKPIVFASHVDESEIEELNSNVVVPPTEVKSDPIPEPEIIKYTEESAELARIANHIFRAKQFDVIKNHTNKDAMVSVMKIQADACNKIKERNE